jgi:hypothetical protein
MPWGTLPRLFFLEARGFAEAFFDDCDHAALKTAALHTHLNPDTRPNSTQPGVAVPPKPKHGLARCFDGVGTLPYNRGIPYFELDKQGKETRVQSCRGSDSEGAAAPYS